jgi:MFS transporter, DHA2 family, multidrug resistance protein
MIRCSKKVRMSLPAAPTPDGVDNPQRSWAFLTLAMAITMAVLDGAIVNIALPTISKDLVISLTSAIWIVNSYQLAITVSLLPLASLADSLGYRRVYWSGLAVFTLSSFACAFSTSLSTLTIARIAQSLGAAGIMSVNIAYIRFIYPRSQLGRGVGNMAVVVAVSSAAGPSVASAILSIASWRWLFLVNVPIGVSALVLAARALPTTLRTNHRIDGLSVVLNAMTFGLLIVGVDQIGDGGSLAPALLELAGAASVGGILVWRQLGPSPGASRIATRKENLEASVCLFSRAASRLSRFNPPTRARSISPGVWRSVDWDSHFSSRRTIR